MFSREKLGSIFDALKEKDIDMWIIAGQETATNSEPVLALLTDTDFIGLTALIFCKDGTSSVVCTPIDYNGYLHEGIFDEVIAFPNSFVESVKEVVERKSPEKIALNYSMDNPSADGISVGIFNLLKKAFSLANYQGELVSSEDMVLKIRSIKTEEEINRIKNACIEAEKIFFDAKKKIKAGTNCKDIYNFFQQETKRKGFTFSWPKSCNPTVSSGPKYPLGHTGAIDHVIQKGDLVNIDFGIVVDGYACDMQRMYYVLKDDENDAPEDLKKAFGVVKKAIELACGKLRPGVSGMEVDAAVRDFIIKSGFDDFDHALGHSVGRLAHDGGPLLAPARQRYKNNKFIKTEISENMIFALEPSLNTRAGHLGLEDEVVVKKEGAEFLIQPQEELYIVGGTLNV